MGCTTALRGLCHKGLGVRSFSILGCIGSVKGFAKVL